MGKIALCNGQLILPGGVLQSGTLFIEGAQIVGIQSEQRPQLGPEWQQYDVQGSYIAPGFIDIHLHGGGGADFMDGTVEGFLTAARSHARYGTTALYPTTLTSEISDLDRTIASFVEARQHEYSGAQLMGMHLEGPYFAVSQRGAQDPRYIRDPNPEEYQGVVERHGGHIARWSAAPELPGAMTFADYIKRHGIMPAIAHTDAVYEDIVEAVAHGYHLVTHLYSGMSGVTRKQGFRFAGVIETALLLDELWVELIADGIHVPASLLKLVYKVKGPERIVLITDAMRASGMPEGPSVLGSLTNGLAVIVEDGVAKLPDRSAFAGSVATGMDLVRNMNELAEVPIEQAVRMATENPAQVMGLSKKGRLAPGMDADVVVFDTHFKVQCTMVGGKTVYQHEALDSLK